MNAFSVGKRHILCHSQHDVITTVSPFPYTAKFMYIGVRNNKSHQI